MATVVNIKGEVFAVNAQGAKRRLQNGDKLQEGEILVTGPGSSAQLDMGGGKTINVPEQQTVTLDGTIGSPVKPDAASAALSSAAAAQQVIQALAAGDVNALLEAEAAAAGLAGGGEQGGGSFVQLMRIAEDTTGVNYEFGSFSQGTVDQPAPGAIEEIAPTTTTNVPPSIGVRIDDPENPNDPGNGRPFLTAAEGTVFEAGLNPDGTDAASNSEFVTGSFQISDDDGASDIQTVTINGQTIAIGNLVGSVIVTPFGVLTITGFADGIATFTYELTTAVTHAGDAPETDIFTLTVSDAESTSDPAEIIISIVDDAPSIDPADASAPALTVDESDFGTNASGSFAGLFTSAFGADGPGTLAYALGVSAEGAETGLVDTATGQPVTLHMNGSVVEGRNADGDVVFTISVDASGNVTLDQLRAVVHEDDNDPNSAVSLESGLVTLTATITDGDGDTASAVAGIGAAFTFLDDGPAISPTGANVPALVVDESDLETSASMSFNGLFSATFGADGEGSTTYTLGINAGATGIVDTATGHAVVLSLNGGVVEGRTTGGLLVFTVSVNSTTGVVTLDQLRAVKHADGTNPNDAVSLLNANLVTLTATIADGDGDTASAVANIGNAISFLDDGPSLFVPATAYIQSAVGQSVTSALVFADKAGADAVGTVEFNITEGSAARDASGNLLQLNGEQLFLFYGGGGDKTQIIAKTAGGTVGYTIDIDPAGDSYTVTTNGIISNGTEVSVTTISGPGGGNNQFLGLINVGGTQNDVLVSTAPGDSVNTSQNTIGISGGQSITTGEIARFDFVSDLATSGSSSIGFTYSTHNLISQFKQAVTVTGGSQFSANLTLTAIIADGDNVFVGDPSGETQINLSVSHIRVFNGTTDVTHLVTLTDNGNSITIAGIKDGWTYQVNSPTPFSALEVQGAASTHTFKLGAFSFSQINEVDPINLAYNIVGTDGDGDSITSLLSATLYPASLTLQGDGTNNTLTGTAKGELLLGLDGDDILIGGGGNDVLYGGAGNDTFQWLAGHQGTGSSPAVDIIADFNNGTNTLDLRDLLQGENAGNLTEYLSFSYNNVTNSTTINVSSQGNGTVDQQIVLAAVDITAAGTLDSATIINNLLSQGKLTVDS